MKMKFTLTLIMLLGSALSAPTPPTFKDVVQESIDDVGNLLKAKAAVIKYSGEAINEAAAGATRDAAEYVRNLDPIEMTVSAEKKIVDGKAAAVGAVFDAKREAIRAVQAAREKHAGKVADLIDAAGARFGAVFNATADGITVTKSVVADYAENATLANAQEAVVEAFEASLTLITDAVNGLIQSLLDTKEAVAESAAEFDSQQALDDTKESFGAAISKSMEGAETLAKNLGLFRAVDTVVKGAAVLPAKVSQAFKTKFDKEEVEEEKAIEVIIENASEIEGRELEHIEGETFVVEEHDVPVVFEEGKVHMMPAAEKLVDEKIEEEEVIMGGRSASVFGMLDDFPEEEVKKEIIEEEAETMKEARQIYAFEEEATAEAIVAPMEIVEDAEFTPENVARSVMEVELVDDDEATPEEKKTEEDIAAVMVDFDTTPVQDFAPRTVQNTETANEEEETVAVEIPFGILTVDKEETLPTAEMLVQEEENVAVDMEKEEETVEEIAKEMVKEERSLEDEVVVARTLLAGEEDKEEKVIVVEEVEAEKKEMIN